MAANKRGSSPPLELTASTSDASSMADGNKAVRVCTMRDLAAAAASLAQSFADDHVSHYFLDPALPPEHPSNVALHERLMTAIVAMHILRGLVTAAGPASDPFACVALWCPPGKHTDGLSTLVRSGLWRMHYKLSREARARLFQEFFPLLTSTKASVLGPRDARSWYLVYLGTRPSGRGLGLARRSVEWVTRKADAEGVPCYLESSNEANPPIYRRWGFELARSITLKRDRHQGPISLDIMVREPVRGGRGMGSSLDEGLSSFESSDTVGDDVKSGIAQIRLPTAAAGQQAFRHKWDAVPVEDMRLQPRAS